jgi:hypothetical protein
MFKRQITRDRSTRSVEKQDTAINEMKTEYHQFLAVIWIGNGINAPLLTPMGRVQKHTSAVHCTPSNVISVVATWDLLILAVECAKKDRRCFILSTLVY